MKGVRIEGLFGAFIVKPAAKVQQAVEEKIMMFGDWYHKRPEEVYSHFEGLLKPSQSAMVFRNIAFFS